MRRWAVAAAFLLLSGCQPDKAEEERARREGVVLTSGQAIDCTAALSEAGRVICAEEDLRAFDRRVAELWTEVSAVTGRPTTLARRHSDWIAERDAGERDWDTGETRARTADELRDFYQGYVGALTEELRLAEAVPDQSPVSALAGGCIGSALNACTAPAAGYLTGPDGRRLAWQIQEGSTDFAGASAGLILFAVDGDTLVPVGWSFEAASFEAPLIFQRDDGLYVAAKGVGWGTGAANADLLFRLDNDRWTEIELESWRASLDEQMLDGLGVWKGVDYRWPEFRARTSVWRDNDANCCPTGGRAVIEFVVEGTSLRLSTLEVTPPD